MEGEGKVTIWTEGLPTAIFTDSHRGGAAAIMKNKGLMVILNIVLYFCQEKVRKIAIFGEIGTIFEVDEGNFGVNGGRFGFFGEFGEGIMNFGEVVVDEVRGGGAEDASGL